MKRILPCHFIHVPVQGSRDLNPIGDWLRQTNIAHEFLGVFADPQTFQPTARYIIHNDADETLFRLKWSNRIK
jgi:hypothetical protein